MTLNSFSMARLHEASDSEASLPDVGTLLGRRRSPAKKHPPRIASKTDSTRCPEVAKSQKESDAELQCSARLTASVSSGARIKLSPIKTKPRSHQPLGIACSNPLVLAVDTLNVFDDQENKSLGRLEGNYNLKCSEKEIESWEPKTPKRAAKKRVNYAISTPKDSDSASGTDKHPLDDDDTNGLSDFVVSDGASETELRLPPRSQRKPKQDKLVRMPRRRQVLSDDEEEKADKSLEECKNGSIREQERLLSAIRQLSLGSSSNVEKPRKGGNASDISSDGLRLEPKAVLS